MTSLVRRASVSHGRLRRQDSMAEPGGKIELVVRTISTLGRGERDKRYEART
jgi:hypothetical protein